MDRGSGLWLRVVVVVAATGAFLVPPDLFLLISMARTEIVELRDKLDDRRRKLAEQQENRHTSERELLRAKSDVEERLNALIGAVRQQVLPTVSSQPRASATITELQKAVERSTERDSQLHTALDEYRGAVKRMDSSQGEFNRSESLIASFEEEIRGFTTRLRDITRHGNNQYLAMRAVSLGALGAFAAALASLLHGAKTAARLHPVRTMLSMLFGGIVSLVLFALFNTRELSVFADVATAPDEHPDYWRTVIVCLVAGAFADRLFVAARERVYQATGGQEELRDHAASGRSDSGDRTKS